MPLTPEEQHQLVRAVAGVEESVRSLRERDGELYGLFRELRDEMRSANNEAVHQRDGMQKTLSKIEHELVTIPALAASLGTLRGVFDTQQKEHIVKFDQFDQRISRTEWQMRFVQWSYLGITGLIALLGGVLLVIDRWRAVFADN